MHDNVDSYRSKQLAVCQKKNKKKTKKTKKKKKNTHTHENKKQKQTNKKQTNKQTKNRSFGNSASAFLVFEQFATRSIQNNQNSKFMADPPHKIALENK